jgi:hypothetical protein
MVDFDPDDHDTFHKNFGIASQPGDHASERKMGQLCLLCLAKWHNFYDGTFVKEINKVAKNVRGC